MAFKDRNTAIQKAIKESRGYGNQGAPLFVVYESGEYHIATDYDLDTWFAGIRQSDIVFCTDDL